MRQVMFIVPEALMDQAVGLRDAFEVIAGARVLDFGLAQWRDAQGMAYSIAAGLLDPDWIAQVQAQDGAFFTIAEAQQDPNPEAILLIETHAPLQMLETLGLSLLDDAP